MKKILFICYKGNISSAINENRKICVDQKSAVGRALGTQLTILRGPGTQLTILCGPDISQSTRI